VNGGDKESAELLEILYKDEITHVAAGIKWFAIICDSAIPTMVCDDKLSVVTSSTGITLLNVYVIDKI
jgi:uncharacterized ferritin-like protein (DUF455 family)